MKTALVVFALVAACSAQLVDFSYVKPEMLWSPYSISNPWLINSPYILPSNIMVAKALAGIRDIELPKPVEDTKEVKEAKEAFMKRFKDETARDMKVEKVDRKRRDLTFVNSWDARPIVDTTWGSPINTWGSVMPLTSSVYSHTTMPFWGLKK